MTEPDIEAIFDAKNRRELGYVPGKEFPKKTYLQKMEGEELDKMEGSNE